MNIDISKVKSIYFIGVGGIGISALARFAKSLGMEVSGINDEESKETLNPLRELGIDIFFQKDFISIKESDMYVYSDAWLNRGPEVIKQAKDTGKPVLSYFEALGFFTKDYYTIAVSGTHGKTTTTAMLSSILEDIEIDPTVIVGSFVKKFGGNFKLGKSKYLVVEADEYMRHFLNLNPSILVITNVDADHLDYYKNLDDIKSAFREMALKIPNDGFIICNPNDENISDVIKDLKCTIIDYTNNFKPNLKLLVPGIHNKKNAACAISVSKILNIEEENILKSLEEFPGTWKRFEFKGKTKNGVLIYDDYAHHPTEVKATLSGFREIYKKENGFKIITIFQPHLFSRTKLLLNDFAKSFYDTDEVWLLPIYYAREIDDGSISSNILYNEINKFTNNAFVFDDFSTLENKLKDYVNTLGEKTIIVTMGASNAYKIGENILNK
jgi:UDP-N-acetylmuramate--alanine ligase